ncbi:hypothetical protein OEZ86_004279 [Tetradesmus obliquus]|nr:hypothetical protein OEZ86_004279 [Tetradesmus obliquus]
MVALPFGWSGSPAWFMRLSRQIGAWLADPPAIPAEGAVPSFFARELYAALKGKGSWAAKVKLSNQAVRDVKVLAAFPRRWNGSCIWPPEVSRVVITYASDEGWGALIHAGSSVLQQQGRWAPGMRRKHIMVRELAAVHFALRAARPVLQQHVVECVIDNSAAYYGIKHWASGSIDLMRVLRKIFWLCDRQRITLLPRLVKSEANPADSLSRFKCDAEWMLDQRVFRQLEAWYGPHSVDLFAAAGNAKLPRFYSMLGGEGAVGANALLQDWEGENAYCAPPWALIGRVLKKLHSTSYVSCTLLVPDFPSSAWYPVLLSRAKSVRCLPLGAMFRRGPRGLIRAKWPLLAMCLEG